MGAETEDKMRSVPPGQSWKARKEAAIAGLRGAKDPGVAIIALGDKLSNMRALYRSRGQKGEAMWEAFHQRDPVLRRTAGPAEHPEDHEKTGLDGGAPC